MKKLIKKTVSFILAAAMVLTIGVTGFAADADASAEAAPAAYSYNVMNMFADFFERLMSLFGVSSNESTNIDFIYEQGDIFEARKYFASSHASTIVKMDNGEIVSAWFAGSGEGGADVRIWYSIYNGSDWSEPKQIETTDTVAHWNPVLQNNGSYTRLYYKVGAEISNWVTKYVDTYDFGKTWTEPKELVEGDTTGGRGPVKNKCIVTSQGIMIAPASTEQGSWKAFFDISTDGGVTWERTDYVETDGVEMIQPSLWEDKDGNIHAMFRTKSGYIYRSDSTDGGYTWSKAYATELMNNNSGVDCVVTDNGWLWLAYNPLGISGFRNKLILSVSKDNGETWEDVMTIENSVVNPFAEFSYPSIVADGNELYISYTYNRRQIKYLFIDFEG